MSDTPDTTAPPPSRIGRAVRWVFGGLAALVLLTLLGFGLWAASPGSLAQALGWGQSFMAKQGPEAGTLAVDGVQGSLLRGGQIARLQWQRDGLSVQATDTRLGLSGWFWADALLGRGGSLFACAHGAADVGGHHAPDALERRERRQLSGHQPLAQPFDLPVVPEHPQPGGQQSADDAKGNGGEHSTGQRPRLVHGRQDQDWQNQQ